MDSSVLFPTRGGWKQSSSPLYAREGLTWRSGDTGIIRKAKGEGNLQFRSPDALRLGQVSGVLCPQTNSRWRFAEVVRSESRPMHLEGSSVFDCLWWLTEQQTAECICSVFQRAGKQVVTTLSYSSEVSTAFTEPCPVVKMRHRGQVGPAPACACAL